MKNFEGIVVEDIPGTVTTGQTVYDNAGKKVGTVDAVDANTGYVMVQANPFSEKDMYIPFRLITNVDPRELFLSVSRDEVRRDYAGLPPRSTQVADLDGTETAVTTEPSGYDGSPIAVERVKIDQLRSRIAVGYQVYTTDMTDLGKITRYDPVTGWMLVEKGVGPNKRNLMIPVTLVDFVDPGSSAVSLVASAADLERMPHHEPAEVVFVEATFSEKS